MPEHEFGHYTGELVLKPCKDGLRMQTVFDFGFLEADGLHWKVPAGATVDGASIPTPLWSIMGGPWDGKYRDASVVHDWYCSVRTADWKPVHLMFYRAMLVSGVSKLRAKVMYLAVYFAGPRWSDMDVSNSQHAGAAAPTKPIEGDKLFRVQHDPLTLAMSQVVARNGMTAFDWVASGPATADRDTEIILHLDKLSEIIERDDPPLQSLEGAIDRVLRFMPDAHGAPRTISVGLLKAED